MGRSELIHQHLVCLSAPSASSAFKNNRLRLAAASDQQAQGVESPETFEPHQAEARMVPGDMVLAYTDGAFEARDASGSRFGIARLRETLQFDPPPRNWPRFVAGAVAQHHGGAHDDDVLIAALTLHSLGVPALRPVEMRVG